MKYPIVQIRGGPGAGKSTLVRRLVYGLANQVGAKLSLKDITPSQHPDFALFQHHTLAAPIAVLGIYQYVLGGCDKVGQPGVVYDVIDKIRKTYPTAGIIFEGGGTSRETARAIKLHQDTQRLKILTLDTTPDRCSESVFIRGTEQKEYFLRKPKDVTMESYRKVIEADFKTCARQQAVFKKAHVPFHYVDRGEALKLLIKWFKLDVDPLKLSRLDMDQLFEAMQRYYENPRLI